MCTDCVEQALGAFKFIENSHKTTRLLHSVLDGLLDTLNVSFEANEDQSLYVVIDDNKSELLLIKNDMNPPMKPSNSKVDFILSCLECDKEFSSPDELREHFIQNHKSIACEVCSQPFDTTKELSDHSCMAKYQCPDCKQYRNTEEALMEHQNRVHQIHVCKECGKSCQGSDKLKTHEEKHANKSQCPKCGKSYSTKDFYLKHVKLCVDGLIDPHPYRTNLERPFSCKECGKRYSTSGGLRVHYRFEHGNSKPHICPHCNKKFTAPSYLKVHMITHTKEKNYVCNICSNRFVSKEALLYHTRRHTGEKPYKCDLCTERFVNASARAEHIKYKHVGPTLMCEICSRKFVTRHFLKIHINRHHEKDGDWNSNDVPVSKSMVEPTVNRKTYSKK